MSFFSLPAPDCVTFGDWVGIEPERRSRGTGKKVKVSLQKFMYLRAGVGFLIKLSFLRWGGITTTTNSVVIIDRDSEQRHTASLPYNRIG